MRIRTPDFETFLTEVHAEQYVGTDDNMPDDFDRWLNSQDHDDMISLANSYSIEYGQYIINECRKIMKEAQDAI